MKFPFAHSLADVADKNQRKPHVKLNATDVIIGRQEMKTFMELVVCIKFKMFECDSSFTSRSNEVTAYNRW